MGITVDADAERFFLDFGRRGSGVRVSPVACAVPRNRVALVCVGIQLGILVVSAPGYSSHALHIDWSSAIPQLMAQGMFGVLWTQLRSHGSSIRERILADLVLAVALMVMLTNIASPAQYVAVALHRPLIDPALARADAFCGINVAALAHWTNRHAVWSLLLTLCYFSLFPQFVTALLLLGFVYADRKRLWEYAFHFHFCLLVTLSALALFPAECAFQYYGFHSSIDQAQFIADFQALRNGTYHSLVLSQLQGLISMPSFHVAGALMVTWAFRGYRRVLLPLIVLNVGLIASTVMSGAHYFVDVVASFVLFGVSVFVYRWWVSRLLDTGSEPLTPAVSAAR